MICFLFISCQCSANAAMPFVQRVNSELIFAVAPFWKRPIIARSFRVEWLNGSAWRTRCVRQPWTITTASVVPCLLAKSVHCAARIQSPFFDDRWRRISNWKLNHCADHWQFLYFVFGCNRRKQLNWARACATDRKTTTVHQFWTIWTDFVTIKFDRQRPRGQEHQRIRGRGAGKGWRSKTKTTKAKTINTITTTIIKQQIKTTTTTAEHRDKTAATTPTSHSTLTTLKSGLIHIHPITPPARTTSKATRSNYIELDRSIHHHENRIAELQQCHLGPSSSVFYWPLPSSCIPPTLQSEFSITIVLF